MLLLLALHPAPRARALAVAALLAAGLSAPRAALAQGVCDGISPATGPELTSVRVLSGLSQPDLVVAPPGDTTRLFIVEQEGRVRLVKDGQLQATPFLDIAALTRSPIDGGDNEEGLLGLAFHPDYARNGWFFVYHTDATGANNVVARYTRSAGNPDLADTATRVPVITFAHPTWGNHNGGMMAFAPDDGYLYIGTGDGGGACDTQSHSQNLSDNRGKLLRLNVNALPYTIPPGNPFAGSTPGNDEIWARGLRNPWRWSFDRQTADLYVADVGQDAWEELDWRPASSVGGENYGWRHYEGDHCPNPSCDGSNCAAVDPHTRPVFEYPHSNPDPNGPAGCSITGGYVYRGCRIPTLTGRYFFADYCRAWIRSLVVSGGVAGDVRNHTAELAPGGGVTINSITSFGEDARGEIYVVDRGGEVFKILPVLRNLEVSGKGARLFLLGTPATPETWTWEDLRATSGHAIVEYQVFRSAGRGDGTFECRFKTASTSWPGGDLAQPPAGSAFSYLVAARNAVERSSVGTGTGGRPRVLSPVSCP